MEEQRKYKIDEAMNKLNLPDYKAALKIIPKQLNIAANTFHNYRKLRLDAQTDIPYEIIRKLEKIFGMRNGMLANYTIDCKKLKELIKEDRQD